MAEVDEVNVPEDVKVFAEKASENGEVKMIDISLIRKNDVALRDVQREDEGFQRLVASIRQRGVLNSILVREQRDINGVKTYGLIDGLQRYSASIDAGLTHIPARIVKMDDAELLEAQIITNMNRIETKPAQLSDHLVRILTRNPFMTKNELAEKICQSQAWLEERLSLTKLKDEIKTLVDNSQINLTNAYALSKIPQEEQASHVDAAMTENPKSFVPRMKARVKEIREAKKSGRDAAAATFTPIRYLQKMSDIETELGNNVNRDRLFADSSVPLTAETEKAWSLALDWFCHFDNLSKAEQKRKHEERETKRKAEVEKRKIERESKKKQEAAEVATSIESGW